MNKKFATSGCSVRGRKLNLSASERKARSRRQKQRLKDPGTARRLLEAAAKANSKRTSERNRKNWKDPVYRATKVDQIIKMQPSLTEKKREAKIKYWSDPKKRVEQSRRSKRNWKKPSYKRRFFAGWLPKFASRLKPSKLHSEIKAAMIEAGLTAFKTHVVVGHYCLDEVDEEAKIVVEINGCFWHACPEHTVGKKLPKNVLRRVADDRRRRTYLERRGWTLIEVWEHDWRKNPESTLTQIKRKVTTCG